ncbi:ABC-type nickel/cobalt efflux system permease component RcnA [Litoreibacter ponti]|uniref:Nickel/cobalt efflux system n=1 Tax=Litoreibacter ponti TaxID=1510457 RepID=A0A2T6BH83_9RHOB|nr:hypothetical protein [Litoreibacter ponti]PTX55412.1 ABC-type nickel/cobalt efflux system permease component RcnA [Litoreibacter ponti]
MRGIVSLVALAVAACGLWLWQSGGFDQLALWAAGEQRSFQNQMAGTLRGLRAGEAGALAALMGACFAYGFFHAVGPGHGKVLIGGYGLGRKVPWLRLSVISLLASLGQTVTAIVLVYAGVWILGLAREQMVGAAEDIFAPVSYAAIAAIGLWLVWRGLRKLRPAKHAHDHHHDHDRDHHHHGDDDVCSSCGHKHGPSLDDVTKARSLRDALALIAGIAIRPCTGALFVLILTWQMGIALAGIAATFAMALGTASVTIAVGLAAIGLRGGILAGAQGGVLARAVPIIEMVAGGLVVVIAGGLLLRAL